MCFCLWVFLCLRHVRLAGGGIMFSERPSVRSSVTTWTRYFENDWTDYDANWHMWSVVQVARARNHQFWRLGGQSSRSHEAADRPTFAGLAEASFSTPLGRVAFLVCSVAVAADIVERDDVTGTCNSRARSPLVVAYVHSCWTLQAAASLQVWPDHCLARGCRDNVNLGGLTCDG